MVAHYFQHQVILSFKEPVCQKECRNGGRCIGPNRYYYIQLMERLSCNDIIDSGQDDLLGVLVSMATQDAIVRLIIEPGPATGIHCSVTEFGQIAFSCRKATDSQCSSQLRGVVCTRQLCCATLGTRSVLINTIVVTFCLLQIVQEHILREEGSLNG